MAIKAPWLRRHQRRMMWLMTVLLVAPLVGSLVWFANTGDARAFSLMILMTLANIVNIINPVTFRRLKGRVREHKGLVCTSCLFPLTGLDPQGRCPECGTDYTFADTIESWRRDFNMNADQSFVDVDGAA